MNPHLMLALLASPSPWTKGGLPEAEKETVAVLGIAPSELVRERELRKPGDYRGGSFARERDQKHGPLSRRLPGRGEEFKRNRAEETEYSWRSRVK
jgi:hypothetical protein